MENLYDYKKFAILYVDDEEKSLKYFTRAFGDEFRDLHRRPTRRTASSCSNSTPTKSAC